MLLKGAEIVIECLKEQGVDTIFGYPGGAVLNIYDALYKYQDEINHVLTAHEQGASHAADGYSRATGKVGVTFAGADQKTATGSGKLGASATGKTDSSIKFFDNQGQFEAYIDEVLMSVAK
mgnify:CR=1 FL=1